MHGSPRAATIRAWGDCVLCLRLRAFRGIVAALTQRREVIVREGTSSGRRPSCPTRPRASPPPTPSGGRSLSGGSATRKTCSMDRSAARPYRIATSPHRRRPPQGARRRRGRRRGCAGVRDLEVGRTPSVGAFYWVELATANACQAGAPAPTPTHPRRRKRAPSSASQGGALSTAAATCGGPVPTRRGRRERLPWLTLLWMMRGEVRGDGTASGEAPHDETARKK